MATMCSPCSKEMKGSEGNEADMRCAALRTKIERREEVYLEVNAWLPHLLV